jgi:hypothetical protein
MVAEMIWVEIVKDRRWERSDGAVVRYDDRTPNSNPAKDSARMFTAWEPGDNLRKPIEPQLAERRSFNY